MEEEKENNTGELNEPEAGHLQKRLTFYSSFEEENLSRYKFWAGLSYSDHLYNVTRLIEQIYQEEIEENQNKPKIIKFSDNECIS